jgi:DNA repair protein RadC
MTTATYLPTDHTDVLLDTPSSSNAKPVRKKFAPIYRVALVRESKVEVEQYVIYAPANVAKIAFEMFKDTDREEMLVILLDTKNKVIGVNTVAVGILNSCLIHPANVFKPAILCNAASIILAHNHPSGDPTPSPDDRRVTQQIYEAGQILGIELLDHLVIGDNERFVSLKSSGVF